MKGNHMETQDKEEPQQFINPSLDREFPPGIPYNAEVIEKILKANKELSEYRKQAEPKVREYDRQNRDRIRKDLKTKFKIEDLIKVGDEFPSIRYSHSKGSTIVYYQCTVIEINKNDIMFSVGNEEAYRNGEFIPYRKSYLDPGFRHPIRLAIWQDKLTLINHPSGNIPESTDFTI